ncbi:MAG: cation:proton antiporter [Vicinamibacterales bacterium]|jgi:Kef-type K+ transport system membrane component KefB|nr:cation:proton antiporter [Vicinamibacterales bacterium]
MDELTSLGLILLLALLAGHLVRYVRMPEVTGYILAGVALGPSVLGWVSHDNLAALQVLSEVALGLILFSIGSVFEFSLFRRIGRQVLYLTLIESALAALLVSVGMLLLGQPWQVAGLLGAVAIATAPASTLMVIREVDSRGPLTDNLLGIIAVNNLLCITAYSLVAAAIDLTGGLGGSFLPTLYRSVYPLVWQLGGSVSLGFLVGLMLAGWSRQVRETGEMLILLVGSILLCVGLSRLLDLSPLVASLAVGATMVNLAAESRRLFGTLAGTDPPFYAIFFVIAGADLDVSLVPTMGAAGLLYVVSRAVGKLVGAHAGARWLGLEPVVQRFLGMALLAQAGLAVGLTLAIDDRYAAFAPQVSTVVLAAVVIYETVGPVSTRFALVRSGEAGMDHPAADAVFEM